jgi:recombination protein RecR
MPPPPEHSQAYPEAVRRLIDEFARLPGIGRRSAERLALHVLKATDAEAMALSGAVADVKRCVRPCRICFNLADTTGGAAGRATGEGGESGDTGASDASLCAICAAPLRDRSTVMVVEQPRDLIALEQTGSYKGVYHVLMGRLSPLEDIGPGDITIAELLRRIDDPSRNCAGVPVREVILALNPTLEADGTALYLAQQLHGRAGVRVTRLARGLPTGSQLEYASKGVLADAIEGRQAMG